MKRTQAGKIMTRPARDFLKREGYRVLRFTNSEVMSNLEGVLMTIGSAGRLPLSPTLSPEGERE